MQLQKQSASSYKNIVLLQDRQLHKLLQAKYAFTNSSCYKLLLFAVTNRKFDSYKIANSYKNVQFTVY